MGLHRLSSSALLTTLTLDMAIAAPATMGVKKPKAASGIPTALYTKAQKRFCLMVRMVWANHVPRACHSPADSFTGPLI